jgi:hypothetical protein
MHPRLLFFELAQMEPTEAYYSSLGRGPRPFLALIFLEDAGLRRCQVGLLLLALLFNGHAASRIT